MGMGWLHAPLLALYPVLSLYLSHRDEVPWTAAALTGLAAAGLAALLLGLLIALRGRDRGGLLTGGCVFSAFAYRPVTEALFGFAQPTRIGGVPLEVVLTALAALLVATALVLRRRDRRRAGQRAARIALIVVAGAVLAVAAVFTFNGLRSFSGANMHRGTLLFWLAGSAVALAGLGAAGPEGAWRLNAMALRMTLVLLALPVATGVWNARAGEPPAAEEAPPETMAAGEASDTVAAGAAGAPWPLPEGTRRPDIYHIVLDAYGRADVLRRKYDLDNEPFLSELRARGFSVAEASTANYPRTWHSFASMFNLTYLQRFHAEYGVSGFRGYRVNERLKHPRLLELLEAWGYDTYGFHTGFPASDLMAVKHRMGTEPSEAARFAEAVLSTTPLFDARRLFGAPENAEVREHRGRIHATLRGLTDLAAKPSPKFVLAHVLIPHQPFVIDAEGRARRFEGTMTEGLLTPPPGRPRATAAYRAGYAAQVQGTNRLVLRALDRLLERMDEGAIVILQGDHGPGSRMNWNAPRRSDLEERYPVLNAIRFPGGRPAAFTDDVSLVSTYRIILNEYLGGTYEPLPAECYFPMPESHAHRFVRVTDRVMGWAGGQAAGTRTEAGSLDAMGETGG